MDQTVATIETSTVATPNRNSNLNQSAFTDEFPRASSDFEESSAHSDIRGLISSSSTVKGERSSMILMKKSTLASLAFLLLAFVAAFGYFFTEWIYERDYKAGQTNCFMEEEVECPFTQDDIDSLTSEIDRMEDLNKQLSNQLDDYEDLTDRLNVSVEELKRQNEILSESNDQYENLNNQLNDTVAELKEQNQFLADQVDIFAELNKDLNETAGRLEDQVDRLEGEVDDLTAQNDRLEDLVGSLTNETDRLSELTDFLEENVNRLEGNIGSLETENNRLENNIADLRTVISFWDEVTDKSDETYVEMTTFLAQQISTNRLLVLEALQNTYHQRVANWDCALKDQFALEAFANDDNLPIPQDRVNEVLAYVDERVLSELCLDKNDFEEYLEDAYTINDINTNRLVASVQRYTWSAIDYYFPESGESGLAAEDWAAAEYDCGKLPANLNYED